MCSIVLGLFLSPAIAFESFFDNDPNTRHAPELPILDAFDLGVLSVCGGWGGRVDKQAFIRLLKDVRHESTVRMIYNGLDGRVKTPQPLAGFIAELANVWFSKNAFEHIFCGEPNDRNLGGMHFVGRFIQAQKYGWAGYVSVTKNAHASDKCRKDKESIDAPIYSTAIEYAAHDERKIKCVSGYNVEMNAAEILLEATLAYRVARTTRSHGKYACLHRVPSTVNYSSHYAVLVIDNDSIRTFYPLTGPGFQQQRKRLEFCS